MLAWHSQVNTWRSTRELKSPQTNACLSQWGQYILAVYTCAEVSPYEWLFIAERSIHLSGLHVLWSLPHTYGWLSQWGQYILVVYTGVEVSPYEWLFVAVRSIHFSGLHVRWSLPHMNACLSQWCGYILVVYTCVAVSPCKCHSSTNFGSPFTLP